jgi:hypothetical protein
MHDQEDERRELEPDTGGHLSVKKKPKRKSKITKKNRVLKKIFWAADEAKGLEAVHCKLMCFVLLKNFFFANNKNFFGRWVSLGSKRASRRVRLQQSRREAGTATCLTGLPPGSA